MLFRGTCSMDQVREVVERLQTKPARAAEAEVLGLLLPPPNVICGGGLHSWRMMHSRQVLSWWLLVGGWDVGQ